MKVGDLVELSAKGRTLKSNGRFVGGVGIITQVFSGEYYDYGVRWFPKKGTPSNRNKWFKRYELKICRADKKCP
jgi:hypothetical protein